jgi:hypothetical protein
MMTAIHPGTAWDASAIEACRCGHLASRPLAGGPKVQSNRFSRELVNRVNPANWRALLMIDDEYGVNIISYYSHWTSNEPKQSDIDALEELRQFPLIAVQCGILMSVLRAKGKINSLKYCVGAVREAATTPDTNLNNYLGYLEHKAAEKCLKTPVSGV